MNKYKNLHLWMFIPMFLMQLGIFRDYWGDFTDNAWSVHVHYWTGTIWYSYLIIQPYLATHGKLGDHKTNGIIGIFMAGGVCLTALSMMHRDIVSANKALLKPAQFGPFQPWFFYGVAMVEIVMMTTFGFAVLKSVKERKKMENHAWWLISTVFIIMMPALGRGIQNFYVDLNIKNWPNIDIILPIIICQVIIILMIIIAAWKYKKLKHPATITALAINIFILFLEPIGKAAFIQEFLKSTIKG